MNAILESIHRVSEASALQIARNRGHWTPIKLVRSLHEGIDSLMTGVESDCKPGCSSCCSKSVEVTEPEAIAIAQHVNSLSPDDRAALITKLKAKSSGRVKPCAFLESDLCSIYEIRPGVCRSAHSLSAESCKSNAATIPQLLEPKVNSEILMAGVRKGMDKSYLKSTRIELSDAVLMAASRADVDHHWMQGKSIAED